MQPLPYSQNILEHLGVSETMNLFFLQSVQVSRRTLKEIGVLMRLICRTVSVRKLNLLQ